MPGKIFVLNQNDTLLEVEEAAFEREDVLQALLARFPSLLAGDDINPSAPRRWLFVSREVAVPDRDEGPGRWSLDHLYLDQDGTPTFVECKRSSDTRGRREVVAQMLDYAANGSRYWSIEMIRQAATERAKDDGTTLDKELDKLLAGDAGTVLEPETFWQTVETKLRTGEVRLVFVADVIPPELRRLVEFLNEQMPRVEVLALEVRHYVGGGQKVLVPRLVGRTEAALIQQGRAKPSPSRRVDRAAFVAACTPAAATFFAFLLDAAALRTVALTWGSAGFSLGARSPGTGERWTFAYGFPPDDFQFYFQDGAPWSEPETASVFRSGLLATGIFREAGRLTLKARIDEDSLTSAQASVQRIFDYVAGSCAVDPKDEHATRGGHRGNPVS